MSFGWKKITRFAVLPRYFGYFNEQRKKKAEKKMVEYEKLEPWKGKYAIVLAVNSPIGVAVSEKLLNTMKMFVIGVDKDDENIQNLIQNENFKFLKVDLKKEDEILEIFQYVAFNYGGADMLINVMDVSKSTSFLDHDLKEISEITDQYVLGYILSIREMIRSMADRKVELGQIVNLTHLSDTNLTDHSQQRIHVMLKRMVNSVTKYAEQELSLRMDFVRFSSISNVKDNLVENKRLSGVSPGHYADAVQYVISMPLHVQIRNVDLEAV